MSDETTQKSAPSAAETPALPEPGYFGRYLQQKGVEIEPLGPDATGNEMVRIGREQLLRAGELLRDWPESPMDFMVCVTGIDWKTHRESVYLLESTISHKRLLIKVLADANDHSPSLYPVWPAVDWHERETFDLMGIRYDGHPDLRRILMPTYWDGYPLRKGYKEEDPRLVWNRR